MEAGGGGPLAEGVPRAPASTGSLEREGARAGGADGPPDWIAEAIRRLLEELREYTRTARAFTLHPARFARAWATGEGRALNPLGFMATALGVLTPLLVAVGRLAHEEDDPSVLADAAGAITPFAYYLAIGAIEHAVLRAFGSRRRLRDSWAMALYAGGGPCALGTIVLTLLVTIPASLGAPVGIESLRELTPWTFTLATFAVGVQLTFLVSLAAGMVGLHGRFGIGRVHVALATVVALAVTALIFGQLHPPGSFGIHLVLAVHRDHGAFRFGFTLGS